MKQQDDTPTAGKPRLRRKGPERLKPERVQLEAAGEAVPPAAERKGARRSPGEAAGGQPRKTEGC